MIVRTRSSAARALLIVTALAVLPVAAACSADGDHDSAERTRTEVTLAVPAPSELFNLPVVLADRLGYYADAGLDVNLVDVGSGTNAVQAVLSGDAQAAAGFAGHPITMAAKGQAFRSFVTIMKSPGMVLAVSPKTDRSIDEVADLKGATIGVSAPGSGTHHFLNFVLDQHGLSADDVSVAGVGLAGTAVAAMEQGQVDAAVMADPALSRLQQRGKNLSILVDTRTTDGLRSVFGTDEYAGISLYARASWLEQNPETARKLGSAITRALAWARDHDAHQVAEMMPADYAGADRALYEATIALAQPTMSPDGRVTPAGAEALRRLLAVSVPEVARADIDLAGIYTNEFL